MPSLHGPDHLGQPLDAEAALQRVLHSAQRCPRMNDLLSQARRLAADTQPVWIQGEPGTGRHTLAGALHALSPSRNRPILRLHRGELEQIMQLHHAPSTSARQAAHQALSEALGAAHGGTVVIDEGGGPDPALTGLLQGLLARPVARLLVITLPPGLRGAPAAQTLPAPLLGRALVVPPLRERREEVLPLGTEWLRGPTFSDDAAVLLEEAPWLGNLRQLDVVCGWLAHHLEGPVIDAAAMRESLPGPLGPGEAHPALLLTPASLQELALSLGEVLRPLLPLLPPDATEDELPWAPLFLDPVDDRGGYRLVLGPGPMDEQRLVAGLQARPRGPAGGSRIGDAPVLHRLGPTWRANLLALLRAAHQELDDQQAGALDLAMLGQALLLAGTPLPPDKLVRLALRLPVDLLEDETAVLVRRLWIAAGAAPGQVAPCRDPAIGRTWIDVARGLLPAPEREALWQHAAGCPRCAEALLAFWQMPPLPAGGAAVEAEEGPLPADATVVEYPEDELDPEDAAEEAPSARSVAVASALSTADEDEDSEDYTQTRDGHGPRPAPGPFSAAPTLLDPLAGVSIRAAPAPDPATSVVALPAAVRTEPTPAPSATSPLPSPPALAALRPLHWTVFGILIVLALVLGTVFGFFLARHP